MTTNFKEIYWRFLKDSREEQTNVFYSQNDSHRIYNQKSGFSRLGTNVISFVRFFFNSFYFFLPCLFPDSLSFSVFFSFSRRRFILISDIVKYYGRIKQYGRLHGALSVVHNSVQRGIIRKQRIFDWINEEKRRKGKEIEGEREKDGGIDIRKMLSYSNLELPFGLSYISRITITACNFVNYSTLLWWV